MSHLTAASFQLIINNALKAYEKRTKKDLLVHPLASQLHACNSPTAILAVLQEQARGLEQPRSSEYSDDRWTKWFDLTVKVLYTFSVAVEERVGLVSFRTRTCRRTALIYTEWQIFSPAKVIFAGVGVLLLVCFFLISSLE